MKTFFLFVFTLLFPFCADAQDAVENMDSAWVRQHYSKREVMIPMRDGVRLFTAVYEPKDKSVGHPVLIYRSCYGSGPYGEQEFMDLWRPTWSKYASDQYILVFQDVRGKNMSEGTFEDLRPFIVDKRGKSQIDEASDTYDTVDWLVKNTHSNERVGVFGISYPGFYAMMAGLSGHPAVKAVSPQAPVTDWYRGDDTHHNGALFVLDMFPFEFWFEHVNKSSFWNTYQIDPNQVNPTDVVHTDVYNDYLKLGTVRNMTRLLGDSCKFWNDMLAHPDLDPWWEERNVAYYCQDVKPAVMVVGGLFDAEDCFGAFTTYNAIRRQSPQTDLYLVGPLNFMHLLIASVNMTLSAAVLFMLNRTMLAVSLLVTLPFFYLSSVVAIRKVPVFKKNSREHYAKYTNWMEPVVNASESIRIFDGEELVMAKAEEESLKIMKNNMKAHKRTALATGINTFSGMTGYLLLLFLGNSMIGSELDDFARMMKITQYRGEMMKSVMMINSCVGRMKGNLPAAERVEEVL